MDHGRWTMDHHLMYPRSARRAGRPLPAFADVLQTRPEFTVLADDRQWPFTGRSGSDQPRVRIDP